ncbi:MAG: hypothetical protein JNM41_03915 [Flavipsychrobacter sp.]|nr:hypothetical protein [Flavipsychrobacter sp.]
MKYLIIVNANGRLGFVFLAGITVLITKSSCCNFATAKKLVNHYAICGGCQTGKEISKISAKR